MVKAYLMGQQREWDRQLGCLAAAYRATVNESTGLTPNLVMLGREVRLPAEMMFGMTNSGAVDTYTSYGDYVWTLRERMQAAHAVTRHHLQVSATRQKEYYDLRSVLHAYKPGDLVWCLSDLKQLHIAPKLRSPYEGPYLVLKKINDLNYLIQFGNRGVPRVLHYNKLNPHHGEDTQPWVKSAMKAYLKR